MKIQEKIKMDSKLANVLKFLDNAIEEIEDAKPSLSQTFLRSQLTELERLLIVDRDKIYFFKELAKEIYNEEKED